MMRTLLVSTCLLMLCLGCSESPPAADTELEATGPLTVYTTFYPTWFFTTAIGREHVRVINPVPEGEDPIFWMPSPEVITAYQTEADLIVLNGAGYARWVASVMLPEEKLVDTGAAFKNRFIVIEEAVEHSHGPDGAHSHGGIDPHLWLDPIIALSQCRTIAQALSDKDPTHATAFQRNLQILEKKLQALDAKLGKLSAGYNGQLFLANHPAYNYLARRYGWQIHSFDFDPETVPETVPEEIPEADYLLWESPPSAEVAAFFKTHYNLTSIPFSPVETPPGEGLDYLSVMEQNLEKIAPLFQ